MSASISDLQQISARLRRDVLDMTTSAGSGHPTSCLSCAELMATLWFHEMQYDPTNANHPNNDTFILSKGHAAPIYYACLKHAGCIDSDLLTLRKKGTNLEGHPLPRMSSWIPAATGSLGQGLAVGAGIALGHRFKKGKARTYVLLGDSECAEGSVWEAATFAGYYKLANLCAIVDLNRLGQRGKTMFGNDPKPYEEKFKAAGWKTITIDGHSLKAIGAAFKKARSNTQPTAIIARTKKGNGISFLEDKEGWHGKTLSEAELKRALKELPLGNLPVITITKPRPAEAHVARLTVANASTYESHETISTREAYGKALARLAADNEHVLALDAEVSNSTYTEKVEERAPKQFIECFIAEQTMISVAQGLATRGFKVAASTFAAFLTRAHDQLRMAALSETPLVIGGSHAGVSIGEDGPSQMGLDDIAMMRTLPHSMILQPADAIATEKLVQEAFQQPTLVYVRTLRPKTQMIYKKGDDFLINDFKILAQSPHDSAVIVGTGITVHEALKAHRELAKQGIATAVIDAYCIKPFPLEKFKAFVERHGQRLVIAEDHYPEGGLGEALLASLHGTSIRATHHAVVGIPKPGKGEELLAFHHIDAPALVASVKRLVK